tara:strand:- start:961 stop:2628 length:1668 start_codon:yes stop_codon:yes gene_type:complete
VSIVEYFLKNFREKSRKRNAVNVSSGSSALAVAACGSGSSGGLGTTDGKGFPSSYQEPSADYVVPSDKDPNFEILKQVYSAPYWVASLEMDSWDSHIEPMLEDFGRVIYYAFPETQPAYDTFDITGWEPATEEIKTATREILSKLEAILNVSFMESNDSEGTNIISVSTSSQAKTAGYSYFPNNFFEIGMDVFIAEDYARPTFLTEANTNYDYEVLLHEIGHALGLKHPFEASGANNIELSTYEDNTHNTAMSYTEDQATFNGTFRHLDWMTLAKFYGVKSSYNDADDIYNFSSLGGTFILDGAGLDTISADATSHDVTIDLRPGSHSHLGGKSTYITAPNQLTISHGSDIENVVTGSGNDTVIGTNLDNIIMTGNGSDTIFAGDGADIIKSGTGKDQIDLSEAIQSRDTVTLDAPSTDLGIDTIYGFKQGALGDIFDLSSFLSSGFELFPLVALGLAPTANFDGGILRLIGSDVSNANDLSGAFKIGGGLETLSMSNGASAIIISANSQSTGEDQSVFAAESNGGKISITELAKLQGNTLDIDQWHIDNFSVIA